MADIPQSGEGSINDLKAKPPGELTDDERRELEEWEQSLG